ncbi:tegument protein U30 [Eptesicus fuscus gammaherpesvirus]|uniref:Tegument protein U30 n=1 Tax=vespertilionid gammaherpesvirus 3 TaxID=2846598 RepID=A0A2D1A5Q6_9GAMA|nr:tegument protein U30 [Eptesicus fuscus gammaherpesvirus]ATA58294.1 tegument protein U30 [Eptesicus fuscus gammaherpesvirus]WAH70888.1 putative capsid assembly protein UL37 [Eptesicus fuscus gammaherpesvirus]
MESLSLPTRSLHKTTLTLLRANTRLGKMRALMDMELHATPIKDLTDEGALREFLNSLAPPNPNEDAGGYVQYVRTHPVWFLLRNATLTLSGGQRSALDVLARKSSELIVLAQALRALRTMSSASPAPSRPLTNAGGDSSKPRLDKLSNEYLLDHVIEYVKSLSRFDITQTGRGDPPMAPTWIAPMRFVEELQHAVFLANWTGPLPRPLKFEKPSFSENMPTLELWLLARYVSRLKTEHDLGKIPPLNKLAEELVTRHQDLFAPALSATETVLTLPVAKQRAAEVYEALIQAPPSVQAAPVLAFREADLIGAKTERFFLYAHVIEALCAGQTYKCSNSTIDGFWEKGVDCCTQLCSLLKRSLGANEFDNPYRTIQTARRYLLQHGLTEEAGETIRTAVLIAGARDMRAQMWRNMDSAMTLILHVTTFTKYFYMCMNAFSPTSLSRARVQEVLALADIESQEAAKATAKNAPTNAESRGQAVTPPWPISHMLRVFAIPPPEQQLKEVYGTLTSPTARSMFAMATKRAWGFGRLLVLDRDSMVATMARVAEAKEEASRFKDQPPPSEEEVSQYCATMSAGESDYDARLVRSPFFSKQFIQHQVYPTMQTILSNSLQKNRALFRWKWLLVFAADTAVGMETVRKPLTLAFLHTADIMSHRERGDMLQVLDNLHEVQDAIREVVPNASFPNTLLDFLYTTRYGPVARTAIAAVRKFVRDMEVTGDKLTLTMRMGAALCHNRYGYKAAERYVEVPVEGQAAPMKVDAHVFRNMVAAIERGCRERVTEMNRSAQELQGAYVTLLTQIEQAEKVATHALRVRTREPDLRQIYGFFVECFKRHSLLVESACASCGYLLRHRFHALFEEPLLSTRMLSNVLTFTEGRDTIDTFRKNLARPVETLAAAELGHTMEPVPLSAEILGRLRELYPEFPQPETPFTPAFNSQSIKLKYSGKVDLPELSVDWGSYVTTALVTENVDLTLVPLTAATLEEALTGTRARLPGENTGRSSRLWLQHTPSTAQVKSESGGDGGPGAGCENGGGGAPAIKQELQ